MDYVLVFLLLCLVLISYFQFWLSTSHEVFNMQSSYFFLNAFVSLKIFKILIRIYSMCLKKIYHLNFSIESLKVR